MLTKVLNPADVAMGAVIRSRRTRAGVSLETMGKACDVTYQQIQKYETGVNRVSWPRLRQIAGAIGADAVELSAEAEAMLGTDAPTPAPEAPRSIEADADRYRFLVARHGRLSRANTGGRDVCSILFDGLGHDLDAAVDAAMRKGGV